MSIGGLVTDNYSYTAFGEELVSGSGTINPHRYVGRYGYYRDMATRQYVRMRELEVTSGRWMSCDPDNGIRGRMGNLYSIINPAKYVDPSGAIEIVSIRNDDWRTGIDDSTNKDQCCGGYRAIYDYNIIVEECPGWLVQQVTVKLNVYVCDKGMNGERIESESASVFGDIYYEAWHYSHGNAGHFDQYNGYTDAACLPPHPNSSGDSSQATKARYFCDTDSKVGGANGVKDEFNKPYHSHKYCQKYAGALICMDADGGTKEPLFWGDMTKEPPAKRNSKATWKCCGYTDCSGKSLSHSETSADHGPPKDPLKPKRKVCGDCTGL